MTRPPDEAVRDGIDSQTNALRLIAGLLLVGAAWQLAALLVPFFLALVLAIALTPVATWLVRRARLPNVLASVLCTLFVALILGLAAGLILFQAGSIIGQSDQYLSRFSRLLATGAQQTGGDRVIESFGLLSADGEAAAGSGDGGGAEGAARAGTGATTGREDAARDPAAAWDRLLRRGVGTLGRWVATGLGGLVGAVAGVAIFLAALLYMLITREDWIDRLTQSSARLGLRPRHRELAKIQHELVTYIGCLALISLGYAVIVTLGLWAIGMPQPLLWGVLAALLEAVPYFGPLIAGILPTIVALSLGSLWQPAAVVGLFAALHFLENYVVQPLLFGRVVEFNPVTILFGALFFGWIWGPLGVALAMPMMILLRGLLVMTPDTPALDALADVEGQKAALHGAAAGGRSGSH